MSYYNGPRIVTDGLVLCLDAGSSKSYPGSGSILYDLSGQNNHGTIYNSPSINNGIITLDKSNDYLEILQVLQPLTIDFWFSTPDTNNAAIIYAGVNTYNSNSWQWSLFYYNNTLFWRPDSGSGGYNITSFVSVNNWYHFIMTRDSNNSKVYINGQNVATSSFGRVEVTGSIRIGHASSFYWNGSFGPLKMYDRILTSAQIQQNYNALRGRFGL